MSRKFKFRAWHSLNKMMVPNKDLYVSVRNLKNDTIWTFMQYAGLVDTHKNEFCEGDICSLLVDGTDTHQEIKRAVIEYNLTVGGFCFKLCDGSGWMGLNSKNLYRAEIIGNIYEHPQMQKF